MLGAALRLPAAAQPATPALSQKPIVLKGHERSLTFVKYNAGGDLLITCSKDHSPNIWFTDDGSRLGTFDGHRGTVWNCDITGAWQGKARWGALHAYMRWAV